MLLHRDAALLRIKASSGRQIRGEDARGRLGNGEAAAACRGFAVAERLVAAASCVCAFEVIRFECAARPVLKVGILHTRLNAVSLQRFVTFIFHTCTNPSLFLAL